MRNHDDRKVRADFRRLVWRCDDCRKVGKLHVNFDAGNLAIQEKAIDFHARTSPGCKGVIRFDHESRGATIPPCVQ